MFLYYQEAGLFNFQNQLQNLSTRSTVSSEHFLSWPASCSHTHFSWQASDWLTHHLSVTILHMLFPNLPQSLDYFTSLPSYVPSIQGLTQKNDLLSGLWTPPHHN